MPTVQRYGPRKVQTDAYPTARKTAAETDISTGAAFAQAKGQASIRQLESLGRLGGTVEQIGQGLGRESIAIREEEQKQADEVVKTAYKNRLSEFDTNFLYDPQTGALNKKGFDAQSVPSDAAQAFEKVVGELNLGLNPRQRQLVYPITAQHAENLHATVTRHAFVEGQAYQAKELDSFLVNATNAAAANAGDPRRVGQELHDAVTAIRTHAPSLGQGPEQVQQQIDATRTRIHIGVIESLLAQDHAHDAKVYYDEAKDQIAGTQRADLERKLDVAGTAKTALDASEALWTQHGPKNDLDPINLDTMETAARKQFADDPKALEATLHFLRERKAGVDASRQDRQDARAGAVWVAVSKGAPLADVTRMPEYLALSGKAQEQVTSTIVARAEHEANRTYAEAGRAAAEESRAYTREQRAEAVKTQQSWSRYWELSDPKSLSQLSENALQAMRGELGDEHVNRLMTQKRALGKSDEAVRAAAIDDDLFKVIAQGAGLNAYSPKTDLEKSELGQLKNAVETEIDREQQRTGKPLTREQKQTIMHGITDRKVMLNLLGRDPDRITALVTNPEDRAKAYVPAARIPPTVMAQALNYARSLSPETQRMPDSELRARFLDRIQRAYAINLLGGTQADMEAVMKGGQ